MRYTGCSHSAGHNCRMACHTAPHGQNTFCRILCRTEHMFFEPERIPKIRKMILSETEEMREEALWELIPYQKGDFKAMYEALEGKPMTVRYLRP